MRIVDADTGEVPGNGKGFVRFIAEYLLGAIVPLVGLIDHLWLIWDARKQTWHDKAAGTLVVNTEPRFELSGEELTEI